MRIKHRTRSISALKTRQKNVIIDTDLGGCSYPKEVNYMFPMLMIRYSVGFKPVQMRT